MGIDQAGAMKFAIDRVVNDWELTKTLENRAFLRILDSARIFDRWPLTYRRTSEILLLLVIEAATLTTRKRIGLSLILVVLATLFRP